MTYERFLADPKYKSEVQRLRNIMYSMRSRCYNPKATGYRWYGGRGIKICDEWLCESGADNFIRWALQNGYMPTLTIDRIDSSGNYEPTNCQWRSRSENSWKLSKWYRDDSVSHQYVIETLRKAFPDWNDPDE